MILAFLFFITSSIVGLAILDFVQIDIPSPIRLVIGLVLGTVINILAIFGASFLFGLNFVTALTVISVTFFPSLIILIKKADSLMVFEKFETKGNWFVLIGFLIISLFIILLFTKSIYVDTTDVIAGNRLVWTDWPVHLAIISSFVHGDNFPPQNPLYAGQIISYPFFADFLSAILQVLGASLKTSLVMPAIVLGLSSVFLLYYLGTLLTEKKTTAIVGVFVGLFWGGLGFWYFLQDLAASSNFWQTLTYPPHEYTFYQEKSLWFFSFLYSELLPQRSFLLALPMFLISLIFLIVGITKQKKMSLLAAGYLVGIMPFFHMHSYVSFLMFSLVFIPLSLFSILRTECLTKTKQQFLNLIIYFALPIIGLGLLQLPFLTSVNLSQTFGFNWGWLKGNEDFFLFWFKNTGFFWPLWLFAILKMRISPLTRNIAIASLILFILPNIFRFAPWPYDNLKIMTYWYFIGAFLVAGSLVSIYQKKYFGKIVAILLFLSLIVSGVTEVTRVFNIQKTRLNLWSKDDINLANAIIEKTPPRSVILAAAIHDHPVTALAGRKIVIGFPGNAWSWGLSDWAQREADVRTMLRGGPDSPYLFQKYNIAYVLISPRERYFDPQLNEEYFAQNYTFVAGGTNYKLYQIR